MNTLQKYKKHNPKRKIATSDLYTEQELVQLAKDVQYGGNPEHKRNPGDFGLTPPSGRRPGKALCDTVKIFTKKEALKYLREGISKRLISIQKIHDKWPQNIWYITNNIVLEAQLENSETGCYHGYPLPDSDPFSNEIRKALSNNE